MRMPGLHIVLTVGEQYCPMQTRFRVVKFPDLDRRVPDIAGVMGMSDP